MNNIHIIVNINNIHIYFIYLKHLLIYFKHYRKLKQWLELATNLVFQVYFLKLWSIFGFLSDVRV